MIAARIKNRKLRVSVRLNACLYPAIILDVEHLSPATGKTEQDRYRLLDLP